MRLGRLGRCVRFYTVHSRGRFLYSTKGIDPLQPRQFFLECAFTDQDSDGIIHVDRTRNAVRMSAGLFSFSFLSPNVEGIKEVNVAWKESDSLDILYACFLSTFSHQYRSRTARHWKDPLG